jgi:hypothetical protein
MATSADVNIEYRRALSAATVKHGSVLREKPTSFYRQYDRSIRHAPNCVITVRGQVQEDTWYEFQGTFANDHTVHGIVATGVTCSCGVLKDRTIRWQASTSEVALAVFEEAFGKKKGTSDDA